MVDARRAYTRTLRIALYVPLAVGIAGALLILARRSDLPDPVATHWSSAGVANGFTSVVGLALATVVLAGGAGGAVAVCAAFTTLPRGQRRAMLGIGIGMSVAVAVAFVLLAYSQAGLADAHEAAFRASALVAAGLAGLSVGALSARLLPEA